MKFKLKSLLLAIVMTFAIVPGHFVQSGFAQSQSGTFNTIEQGSIINIFENIPEFSMSQDHIVGSDGTIYSSIQNNKGEIEFIAISKEGTVLWQKPWEVRHAPALSDNGILYIIYDNAVHAVRTDGTELWSINDTPVAAIYLAPI